MRHSCPDQENIVHEIFLIINIHYFLSLDKLKGNGSSNSTEVSKHGGSNQIAAKTFAFRELAAATRNFRGDCLLGEGGFGRVYKGRLENSNQV